MDLKGKKKKPRLLDKFHEDFLVSLAPLQALNWNSEDLCLIPGLTDYSLCVPQASHLASLNLNFMIFKFNTNITSRCLTHIMCTFYIERFLPFVKGVYFSDV